MGIKIDARLENADWTRPAMQAQLEEEKRLVAATKLLKHRPGGVDHDQSEHGNWSQGTQTEEHEPIPGFQGPLADVHNSVSELPDKLQAKVLAQSEKYLGTTEEITQRYRDLMSSAAARPLSETEDWALWYEQRHAWGSELGARTGFTTSQTLSATSAMSPGLNWESNEQLTEHLLTTYSSEKPLMDLYKDLSLTQEKLNAYASKYSLTPVDLSSGIRLKDIEDPQLAAVAWAYMANDSGIPVPAQYGYLSFGDSIRILKGDSPESVLRGIKTRSFYNNMLALDGDNDVTIDIQMLGAARGLALTKQERKAGLETKLVGTPSISNKDAGKDSVGVRPHIADITRIITDEWNASGSWPWGQLQPRQVQAIIWNEFKLRGGE